MNDSGNGKRREERPNRNSSLSLSDRVPSHSHARMHAHAHIDVLYSAPIYGRANWQPLQPLGIMPINTFFDESTRARHVRMRMDGRRVSGSDTDGRDEVVFRHEIFSGTNCASKKKEVQAASLFSRGTGITRFNIFITVALQNMFYFIGIHR